MIPQMRDYLFYTLQHLRFINGILVIKALSLKIIDKPASNFNTAIRPDQHSGLFKV
ncbi:hypothetical protein GGD38_000285 [Chitinophagaceae bacterium OAS944]|nr:hypothetical protein [Chitinophagaceae bacterium OAS944]